MTRRDRRDLVLFASAPLSALALHMLATRGDEEFLLIALLRYGPPLLPLAPMGLIALVFALRRRWRWLLALTLLALPITVRLLPVRLAPRAHRPRGGWRLMAWNVEKYDHGVRGVISVIRRADPDVICLSEAGRYFWHPDALRRPEPLDQELAEYTLIDAGELRVYSRLPVLAHAVVPLRNGEPTRPLLHVTVDARPDHEASEAQTAVEIVCMHAPPTYLRTYFDVWAPWSRTRRAHAQEVCAALPRGAVVLTGDFNASEAAPTWSCLEPLGLVDQWTRVGSGLGVTTAHLQRIDRAFATDAAKARAIEVFETDASDHHALLVDFER